MHDYEMAADNIAVIDAHYLTPRRMSIYLIVENGRAAFVDNNTVHAVPRMMAALQAFGLTPGDVDYAIVTHVHLDHAGGTAELLKQCPNATALVHPKTRRHLANPKRLVDASRQIYGDQFDEIYGQIDPVPEVRMKVMADNEVLKWGNREWTFFHTLGHASHHYCVYDSGSDGVFTGDSFGIAYRELQTGTKPYLFAAATPTEFDPADARQAVERILSFKPDRVYLGHYGSFDKVEEMAVQLLRTIDAADELIDEAANSSLDDSALRAHMQQRTREITLKELAHCGVSAGEETMRWVDPDIMLNAKGILAAAAKRRRRSKAQ